MSGDGLREWPGLFKAKAPAEPKLAVGGGGETCTPMPVRGGNNGMQEGKHKILGLSANDAAASAEVPPDVEVGWSCGGVESRNEVESASYGRCRCCPGYAMHHSTSG